MLSTAAVLPAHLTIDCSSGALWRDAGNAQASVNRLMDWVRCYPRREAIHVVLRTTLADRRGRPVKHMLQALGCTVTMRSAA